MLNPIFSKKVQRQKHPGKWGIVEHQIPNIKMLFKTNTIGHKHPSIRFLSSDSSWPVIPEVGFSQHRPLYSTCQSQDTRLAPSQWETALLCNDVSHWLGTSLDLALTQVTWDRYREHTHNFCIINTMFRYYISRNFPQIWIYISSIYNKFK